MFTAKVRRIGTSKGIIIPASILSELGVSEGDVVHVITSTSPIIMATEGHITGAERALESPQSHEDVEVDIDDVFDALPRKERDAFVISIFERFGDSELVQRWQESKW